MADIDLGNDDGFINITIDGKTLPIDLWDANNRIFSTHEAFKDKPDTEYGDAMSKMVASLGYPPVSHRMARIFADAVLARVNEVKKNTSPSAASPASTPA